MPKDILGTNVYFTLVIFIDTNLAIDKVAKVKLNLHIRLISGFVSNKDEINGVPLMVMVNHDTCLDKTKNVLYEIKINQQICINSNIII